MTTRTSARKTARSKPARSKPAPAPVQQAPAQERIVLPARLEIAALEEVCAGLRGKFPPRSAHFIMDGSELTAIDTSGIQLLIAFIRGLVANGCKVEWENYSIPVYQLACELGVAEQLGD